MFKHNAEQVIGCSINVLNGEPLRGPEPRECQWEQNVERIENNKRLNKQDWSNAWVMGVNKRKSLE